jgi:hypothetical protein
VPLLDLFGQTVLATPTLDQLPGVSDLWNNNWQIVLACYVLFIIVAGILLMAHESLSDLSAAKTGAGSGRVRLPFSDFGPSP